MDDKLIESLNDELLKLLQKSFVTIERLLTILDENQYSSIVYSSRTLKYFDGIFTVHKNLGLSYHEIVYQGTSFPDALDALAVRDNEIDLSVYNE